MKSPSEALRLCVKTALALALTIPLHAQTRQTGSRLTENVFLITTDGLRWQEVFGGADSTLLFEPSYTRDTARMAGRYWAATPAKRREKLLPFVWNTLAKEGQLYGNRAAGSKVNVSNPYWFSYPGYNEILTGYGDEAIDSNDKKPNPNVTVLEFLNQQRGFRGKVAAFASWNVFPWIVNEERSGVPVNAGEEAVEGRLSERQQLLNELQTQLHTPWGASARHDVLTYHFAKEYLRRHKPRVLLIAFDETDDHAHDGNYTDYLESAHRVDALLADLWATVQADPHYRGKTTFIVTTDHGRGHRPRRAWREHGSKTPDSYQIWMGFLGPDTPALGEVSHEKTLMQNQIAQTLARFLGLEFKSDKPTGEPIPGVFKTE